MARRIVLFLILLCWANLSSAGTDQKIGECPSDSAVSTMGVLPEQVEGPKPSEIASFIDAVQSKNPKGRFSELSVPTAATAVPSAQAIAIDGLAGFIQARVQAELQESIVDNVLGGLCDNSDSSPYFPNTCLLSDNRDKSYLNLSHSYSVLVTDLRTDVKNLGACALYMRQHTYLGYRLKSIFDQHSQGVSLEQLIYSLTTSGNLNVTELQKADKSSSSLLAQPGNDAGPAACTASGSYPGKITFNGMCGLVLPFVAYTAAIQAKTVLPSSGPPNAKQLVTAYGLALAKLIEINKICDETTPDNCPLELQVKGTLEALLKSTDSDSKFAAASQRIMQIFTLGDDIQRRYDTLTKDGTTRTDVAEAILAIGNDTLGQFNLALSAGLLDLDDQHTLSASIDFLSDFYGAYIAFEAKEYVIGVDRLEGAMDCLKQSASSCGLPAVHSKDKNTTKAVLSMSNAMDQFALVGGAVASLAEAKSSDDFTNTLNALASPVDAWKIRHQQDLSTVQAFGGFRLFGHEGNNVPGFGTIESSDFAEVTAPIGFAQSTNSCWIFGACGYFFSVIDVGNVLNQPRDIPFAGGTINGSVDNKFSNVVEPGFSLFFAPSSSWPLVIGIGYALGPPDYRTVTYTPAYNGSAQGLASRHYVWGLFIAFDVPIFILN